MKPWLLQETPELVPDGETPQNVAIVVFDDLVNQVQCHRSLGGSPRLCTILTMR